jgi:subtilisin family serine protease
VPTDPYYGYEWHLPKINAPSAWDVTTGTSAVTIAILDSGVDVSHPDLAPLLVPGWNYFDNNANITDVNGHGTSVAGAAAAADNNARGRRRT